MKQCFPLPGIGDHDAVAVESITVVQKTLPLRELFIYGQEPI